MTWHDITWHDMTWHDVTTCCYSVSKRKPFNCRSQWPRGLRRVSAAARLLGLWVQIPPGAWMLFFCECCVLSGRGFCDGLITHSEESCRVWCVWVWSRNLNKAETMAHWRAEPWKPPNWNVIGRPSDVGPISITFAWNLLPCAWFLDSWTLRMGPIGCPKTSVRNYHYSLRNNPEQCSFILLPSTDKNSCDLDSMGSITSLPANLTG